MVLIDAHKTYYLLAALRIILVLVPQTGYIHPDEYFQSIEVLSEKILNLDVNQPWEYNVTFPVRSASLSYFTIGASLKMLKTVDILVQKYLHTSVINAHYILVFPRMLMCLCSFLVDYSLYKICVNNNERYQSRLLILASSYVIFTYGTRTFSNSFELVLFAVLLYFVSESMTLSNTVAKERDYINLRYKKAKNIADKVRWHKLRSYLKSDTLCNCFSIATITVIGFFNRPTFLAFAVGPVFFWLYRGIGSKSVTVLQFHWRSFVLLLCAIPAIVFSIVIDSFYFGYISWGEIGMLDVTINSFVFTPWNFVKYNINMSNLAKHGLHPRLLHVLVNIPLLFNILGICGSLGIISLVYKFCRCQYHLLPTVRSIRGLMTTSMFIPVVLLSYFPHQEPRFLIPIIVPLVYLHSTNILAETDSFAIKIREKPSTKPRNLKTKHSSSYLFKMWILINTSLIIFYGFIHQAGVLPFSSYVSSELTLNSKDTFHIVTSHVYSIPQSFFIQPRRGTLYKSGTSTYTLSKRVYLYEKGSDSLESVLTKISALVMDKDGSKNHVYLVMPSSLRHHLKYLLSAEEHAHFGLRFIETFYPHLSIEAFPDVFRYCLNFFPSKECKEKHVLSPYKYITTIFGLFGLDLFVVDEISSLKLLNDV